MNREIKFRAWDKVAKKFLCPYPDGFHILGETTCFDLITQQLQERSPDKNILDMLNDVIIIQYTGLKDKNGKEIYEGDIIKWQAGYYKAKRNQEISDVVIFHEGIFITKKSKGCISALKPLEIVGNIFEILSYYNQNERIK